MTDFGDIVVEVVELTYEEGHAMADEFARVHLGIGVDEFFARYDAGEYNTTYECDHPVLRMLTLEPYVRPVGR